MLSPRLTAMNVSSQRSIHIDDQTSSDDDSSEDPILSFSQKMSQTISTPNKSADVNNNSLLAKISQSSVTKKPHVQETIVKDILAGY